MSRSGKYNVRSFPSGSLHSETLMIYIFRCLNSDFTSRRIGIGKEETVGVIKRKKMVSRITGSFYDIDTTKVSNKDTQLPETVQTEDGVKSSYEYRTINKETEEFVSDD